MRRSATLPTGAMAAAQSAMERGDYRQAEALVAGAIPETKERLQRFRTQMELHEEAVTRQDWRVALRALADARIAVADARLQDFEQFIATRLRQVMNLHRG